MRIVIISKKYAKTIVDAAKSTGVGEIVFLEELSADNGIEKFLDGSIVLVEETAVSAPEIEFFNALRSEKSYTILICESEADRCARFSSFVDYVVPPDKERIASAVFSAASILSHGRLNKHSHNSSQTNGYKKLVKYNGPEKSSEQKKIWPEMVEFAPLLESRLTGMALLEDLEIVEVNGKFLEIAEREYQHLRGRSFLSLIHDEDRGIVEKALKNGGVAENVRLVAGSGLKVAVLEVRHLDESGKRRLCLVFEVSEYIQEVSKERKLREAYKTVYELSPYPIVVHDRGKIVMYNRKAAEFFKSRENLLGKNLLDFMVDESKSRFLRKIESLMLGFETCPVEEIRFEIGGDLRETIINCRAINLSGKDLIVSIIVDLTENVRVSRLLRIINKINTSLVEFKNRKLVLQTALKELEREYNRAFAVLMLNGGFEVIHAGKEEVTESIENECVKKAMELQDEVFVKQGSHPDCCVYRGMHDNYETAVFPLKISDNLFGFLVILARRVFMDAEIKLLRTLVGTLAYVYHKSELEEIRIRTIDQLKHNIREFSLVVDRIKNPLAVIYGYCELADEFTDASLLAVKIREEVEKIARLVKQLERDWQASEDLLEFIENMRK